MITCDEVEGDLVLILYGRLRVNNAGIAGEGSREGYEPSEDPEAFSAQLLKSEFKEWADIYQTNVIAYYVGPALTCPIP
jgi:hypothetical protein